MKGKAIIKLERNTCALYFSPCIIQPDSGWWEYVLVSRMESLSNKTKTELKQYTCIASALTRLVGHPQWHFNLY